MKIHSFTYALPVLLAVPVAFADISLGQPSGGARAAAAAQSGAYHSDLLASNAVLASLKEIRSVPVVNLETVTPESQQIAVFEVKQNLAHRRYDRMGDGPLQPGKLFPVSLAADVPGQDAALADKIRAMQPGDEAVMNIDHIYLFREEGNENVRACTRFATAEGEAQSPADAQPAAVSTPTPTPAAVSSPSAPPVGPAAAMPGGMQTVFRFLGGSGAQDRSGSYSSSVRTRITMQPDAQGVMRRVKVEERREVVDGKETFRKFINDVEVDPQTDQPLTATPAPQPAAAPDGSAAPQPEQNDSLPPIPEPPTE